MFITMHLTFINRRLLSFLLLLSLGWELPNYIHAQIPSTEIFRFLRISTSAEMAGMGGDHVGLWNADGSAFFANPAYLSSSDHGSASLSFVNYFADARYSNLHYAYYLEELGTIAAGVQYASYGDMRRFDESGVDIGSFNAGDYVTQLSLSRRLYPMVQSGFSIQWLHSSLDHFNASAFAFSGGLIYTHPKKILAAGITFQHLGWVYNNYLNSEEKLPLNIALGVSFKPEYFPFLLALTFNDLHRWELPVLGDENPRAVDHIFRHLQLGGEATIGKYAYLRWGYNPYQYEQTKTGRAIDLAGTSIGLGIVIQEYQFNISRQSYSRMGGVVQVSFQRIRTKSD